MLIRPARPDDLSLLEAALYEAFTWSGDETRERSIVLARPEVGHYVHGWPRPGDFGVVAVDDGGVPLGAAWCRLFPADDRGYGFVAADVPELSIAVRPGHRGRGVGRALLVALLIEARDRGHRALSLSVEDGNPARRLYAAVGFRAVGRNGGSDTMLALTADAQPS